MALCVGVVADGLGKRDDASHILLGACRGERYIGNGAEPISFWANGLGSVRTAFCFATAGGWGLDKGARPWIQGSPEEHRVPQLISSAMNTRQRVAHTHSTQVGGGGAHFITEMLRGLSPEGKHKGICHQELQRGLEENWGRSVQ